MRSPGICADLVFSGACVTAGAILHFEQNEIPKPAFVESPRSGKSGDTSADNHDGDLDSLFRTRERRTIAQPVAHQMAVVDEISRNGTIRLAREADQGGAEELAASAAQCVISRQSRS